MTDDRPWGPPPAPRWSDDAATAGRQPRARATRRSLLLAASRLLAEHGYHGATLQDVTAAAGTTKGAMYFHFSSKRALVEALLVEVAGSWDDLVARIEAAGHDPLRTLLVCYDAYTGRLMHDPTARAAVRVSTETDHTRIVGWVPRWVKTGEDMLARAQDAGCLATRVDPAWLSRHLLASALGTSALVHRSTDQTLWDGMNDLWSGLLPSVASTGWLTVWRRSNWAHRPLPDPALFGRLDTGA